MCLDFFLLIFSLSLSDRSSSLSVALRPSSNNRSNSMSPDFPWIGLDRWFRCSGRGWIDVVGAVVERRWFGGWVVWYWSATLVRWALLLRRSAVGWGWGRPGWRPVDGSTPVKLEVDSAGARQILDSSRDFGGSVAFFFLVVQLCPFFGGSVLIGADRWFRCSGRGWIDIVCVVVERRWSGGWVVRYWSATLVRWVLLLCHSAVGWGWGRPESEREMKTKIKEND
jgi:hypothetical protein